MKRQFESLSDIIRRRYCSIVLCNVPSRIKEDWKD